MTHETRAFNEVGAAAMLKVDPILSQSFSVTENASVFRDRLASPDSDLPSG